MNIIRCTMMAIALILSCGHYAQADSRQPARVKFVKKLIKDGAIQKIDYPGGNLPHVWVTPMLLMADYQTKEAILTAVFAYAYDGTPGTNDMIIIRHSITGKRIGRVSMYGLDLN